MASATPTRTSSQSDPGRSGRSGRNGRSGRSGASGAAGRRRRSRRIWPLVLVGVLVVALLSGVVWLVGFSSVLAAGRVEVSGTTTLSDERVHEVAAVPLGVPLARQDLTGIANRVAALPQVERVRVDRAWPDAVQVAITERTPVLVAQNGNGFLLVDRYGVAYLPVRRQPDNLPLTTVGPSNTALLADVGAVSAGMPAKLRGKVKTLRADSPYALTVVLDSGVEVAWGSSEQSTLKGEVALALLKQDPKAVDVSAPHHPTIR